MKSVALIDEVLARLPSNVVESAYYEASDVIIYTNDLNFLRSCDSLIRSLVSEFKKRIIVRASQSLLMSEEEAKKKIEEIIPKEAEIEEIYFEPEFSKVIIHAKRPGIAIGRNGEIAKKVLHETGWMPSVKKSCDIPSELVTAIRKMLHKNAAKRKEFLHELGKRIYQKPKPVEYIRVCFLGGAQEVGRSCILVKTNNSHVMLDCGVSVAGPREFPYLEVEDFVLQKLNAVVISHAHLDHCGLLPYLYHYGYRGPCFMTEPTRDLAALLCMDYVNVCEREHKQAPYSIKAIEQMILHCVTLRYGEVMDITCDFRITLENAGHMLGSSLIHMNIGNGTYNLLYTGDLKFGLTQLFSPASTNFARVEGVIIEATYGSREDVPPRREEAEKALIEAIKRVIERGGKVLIPSFAAERGQEVVAIIANSDDLGDVPIYLDGMLWDATAIHTAYPEFLSRRMQKQLIAGKNPFLDKRLKAIGSQIEREQVINEARPSVIIATSGMLNGGPILEYLEKLAGDERNALIFVGYQGEGTLGRRIQKGRKHVVVNNKPIEIKLEVITIEGLSGHSSHRELMNFISRLRNKPRKILVNHGEPRKCIELARCIRQAFRIDAIAPKNLETIRLK